MCVRIFSITFVVPLMALYSIFVDGEFESIFFRPLIKIRLPLLEKSTAFPMNHHYI